MVAPSEASLLIKEIEECVSSYVNCWSKGTSGITTVTGTGIDNSDENMFIDNYTPCEKKYLVFIKEESTDQMNWRYKIEDLSYDVVMQLPIILLRSLRAQSVNFDHRVLWSWLAQVVFMITEPDKKNILDDREVKDAFLLLVRINLSSYGNPIPTSEIRKLNRIFDTVVSFHIREMIIKKVEISFTFSFPILERLIKLKCKDYVELDGKAVKPFGRYEVGDVVSSLGDLLRLLEEKVASDHLKKSLISFKSEVLAIFKDEKDAWSLIYKWRNNMLHGSKFWALSNGVIVNLICLILLDYLKDSYTSLVQKYNESHKPRFLDDLDSPWIFYPPNLF